jgi:predicted CopG family antitoxin
MKTILIDQDVYAYLLQKASGQPDAVADVLRRELHVPQPQTAVEVDENLYGYIASQSVVIGESASDILRRTLALAPAPEPSPQPAPSPAPDAAIFEFHVASGTGSGAWNTREQLVTLRVGRVLRIVNDDSIAHRLHTPGRPFPHPAVDVPPGGSQDFVLATPYDPATDPPLYDHDSGPNAVFWLRVTA